MSMNSVGRAIDNIYIERFWRSVKYEDVYQKLYPTAKALFDGLTHYIRFYNHKRPHQSLNYATPAEVYRRLKQYTATLNYLTYFSNILASTMGPL